MLNNHPSVAVPMECGFAVWLHDSYKGIRTFDEALVRRFAGDVAGSRKFETWGIDKREIEELLLKEKFMSYREMAAAIYRIYALKHGKMNAVIGDKNNFYIRHIAKIKEIFGTPKLIFMVRDGRDVACSYKELSEKRITSLYAPVIPATIDLMAEEWARNNNALMKESSGSTLLITYESLVQMPHQTLERVCAFLGVDFNASMLEYYHNNDEPEEFLQWKTKTLDALDTHGVGRYKTGLSQDELSRFETVARDALRVFGYSVNHE